jgi:hypothetical protein
MFIGRFKALITSMRSQGKSIGLFEKCCPLPNMVSITNATTINATRQAAVKHQTKHAVRSVARIGLALITFLSSRNRLIFVCILSPWLLCGRPEALMTFAS